MAKWAVQKWFFDDNEHAAYLVDECVYGETFRTKREAEASLADMYDSMDEGAETLLLNNPGDANEYIDKDWYNDNIQYEVGKLE